MRGCREICALGHQTSYLLHTHRFYFMAVTCKCDTEWYYAIMGGNIKSWQMTVTECGNRNADFQLNKSVHHPLCYFIRKYIIPKSIFYLSILTMMMFGLLKYKYPIIFAIFYNISIAKSHQHNMAAGCSYRSHSGWVAHIFFTVFIYYTFSMVIIT